MHPIPAFSYNAASGGDAVLVAAHLANNTVGSCGDDAAPQMLMVMMSCVS